MSSLSNYTGTIQPPIISYDIISTVDQLGYCWFSRERNAYDGVRTGIGVVQNEGTGWRSGIVNVNNTDNTVQRIGQSSYVFQDDHDEACFLKRSSDNRFLCAYAEHNNTSFLRWKIATSPNDLTSWGAEKTHTVPAAVSYAMLYEASNGTIFYFFRNQSGQATAGWHYCKSTDGGETFGTNTWLVDMDEGDGSQAYIILNYDKNNPDDLHFLGASTHPDKTGFTDSFVYHAKFNLLTETFTDTFGNVKPDRPINRYTDVTRIEEFTLPEVCWIEDVSVNSNGYPRVLYYMSPDKELPDYAKNKYRMYSEFNGTSWSIPFNMGLIQNDWVETDATINEKMYGALSRFDDRDENTIWESRVVTGTYGDILEIFKTTRVSSNSFTREQITENSQYDNWRPNSIREGSFVCYWLQKLDYSYFTSFNNRLILLKEVIN